MHVANTTHFEKYAQTDAAIVTTPEQRLLIGKTAAQLHAALAFSWLSHAIICTWVAENHCSSVPIKIVVFVLLVCRPFLMLLSISAAGSSALKGPSRLLSS